MGKKKESSKQPQSVPKHSVKVHDKRAQGDEESSGGKKDKEKSSSLSTHGKSGGGGGGSGGPKVKTMKKGGGGGKVSSVTIRPKLASVHETSAEIDDGKPRPDDGGKCLDESERCRRGEHHHPDCQHMTATGGQEGVALDEANKSCPIYFGVRSYLHHFYETVNQHPNTPGTEEDFLYLIHPKSRRCGALWFKTGLIIGATLFLLGAIAIVIGYAIPRQDPVVGRNAEFEIIDKDAVRFNDNLDICKLIGLGGFCSGGLVLVVSLLAPTFTNNYWDEDLTADQEPFRVSLSSSLIYENEPKSPIPVTEKHVSIQPNWVD